MRLLIFYVSPTIVKQDSNSLTLSTVRFYYDCEGCYSLPLKDCCGCCTRLSTLLEYGPTFRMVVKLSVDISITIAIAIQRLFKLKRLLLTHTYWYQKQGTEQVDSHTYTGNHRKKSQIIKWCNLSNSKNNRVSNVIISRSRGRSIIYESKKNAPIKNNM